MNRTEPECRANRRRKMERVEFHCLGKPMLINPRNIIGFSMPSPDIYELTILNRCHNEVDVVVDESYSEIVEKLKGFEWIEDLDY